MSMLDPVRRALHESLRDNPARLSAKEIAAAMGEGVHLSTLYGWSEAGEDGEPAKKISLARLIQFTIITRDARPLAAFCELAGYACLPMPGAAAGAPEPAALRAIKDFSEFMEANASALLDGEVTRDEFARLEKEGREAQMAIAAVLDSARQALARRGKK